MLRGRATARSEARLPALVHTPVVRYYAPLVYMGVHRDAAATALAPRSPREDIHQEGPMADYNILRDRVDLYVKATGLTRAEVNDFRKTPTSEWTRASDRRIGRAIRGLERLWYDDDVTQELWRRTARGVLRAIRDFLAKKIDTVKALAARIASAINSAFEWCLKTAEAVDDWIERHPRVVKVLMLIGSALANAAQSRRSGRRTA